MSSQYGNMVNFSLLTVRLVPGTPVNLNRFHVLASLLQQRLLGWYTIYTFSGAPRQVQNSLCIQVLCSILAVLLHGTRAAAISENLWHATRNGSTELSQRMPPIFGWASITVLRKEDTDWMRKCMEYEVDGSRPRGRPKTTWREIVQKDCQARSLNREDAMDRGRWKKLIKIRWWSGWWVGECFFWYRLTRVAPDKGP